MMNIEKKNIYAPLHLTKSISSKNSIIFINIFFFMSIMLIDIHCHLDHVTLNKRINEVVENAKNAGLKVILAAGVNPETNRMTLELSKKFDIIKASLGIYPPETLQKEIDDGGYPLKPNIFSVDEEISFIEKNKDKISSVGECGLDYGRDEDKEKQKDIFKKMIALAERVKKPIIVHSRKAEPDAIDILESSSIKKVLLHCFCGRKNVVKRAAELGYYFSIPTNVVRAQNFQLMAEEVDINQLFCETDSPYLSPFRGKTNEPAFVAESYKKIADIKGMELKEVVNNIWMNWQRVF